MFVSPTGHESQRAPYSLTQGLLPAKWVGTFIPRHPGYRFRIQIGPSAGCTVRALLFSNLSFDDELTLPFLLIKTQPLHAPINTTPPTLSGLVATHPSPLAN